MNYTRLHFIILFVLLLIVRISTAQSSTNINAQLDDKTKSITITQTIQLTNNSNDVWSEVYLTDWAHSFSSKTTPLARRFTDYFEKKFHLAPDDDRGYTQIDRIANDREPLQYSRPEENPDILKVILKEPLPQGSSISLKLDYKVVLPDARFTDYGVTRSGDYNLRYWFISPAVYDHGWQFYSNKNLNDRYFPPTDITLNFSIPKGFNLITDLTAVNMGSSYAGGEKILRLEGLNHTDAKLFLIKESNYETVKTDYVTIESNLHDNSVPPPVRAVITDRIAQYLDANLGPYPYEKLLVTNLDYKDQPVYGLNDLPDFISPFPDGFQYEVKILKTTINNYVNNTLLLDPRRDRWLLDGIKVYLFHNYLDEFYPKLKVIGNLDKYWLVKQFYASKLEFNDQFNILYNHISRINLDQSLNTRYDRLIEYNKNIGFSYKSGVGLLYLDDYLEQESLSEVIKEFYNTQILKPTNSQKFENLLRTTSSKNLDWFFKDYLTSNKRIDYALKNSRVKGDSVYIDVKNKTKRVTPVSVYALKNDSIISKRWVSNVKRVKTISYPKDSADRFVLNYENVIPEHNLRNNYEKPSALLGIDKPLQLKLLQDFENPTKNQLFFMPVFEFNVYDGIAPGLKLYNKTILTKNLNYKLEPQFGLRSKKIVGRASISYRHDFQNRGLYQLRYGLSGSNFSYAEDLSFTRVTPFINFRFRPSDLRSDKTQSLSARFVSVQRQQDPNIPLETPNYNVLNLRYSRRSPGIINAFNTQGSIEIAENFGKVATTLFYRHLYLNNRQLNVRLFGGAFLYNNTQRDGDFFSFALDRPTDYLFDFNYYARSEDSGLFSQQIIIAEGGFKSQLDEVAPAFANEWLLTANASTTLWKYFYAYGDIGVVKNKTQNGRFVYDSGIQVSLLDDFFELYFPIYSNLGWEIGQPNYDQKIRFQVELSIDTVIRLFSRKWY